MSMHEVRTPALRVAAHVRAGAGGTTSEWEGYGREWVRLDTSLAGARGLYSLQVQAQVQGYTACTTGILSFILPRTQEKGNYFNDGAPAARCSEPPARRTAPPRAVWQTYDARSDKNSDDANDEEKEASDALISKSESERCSRRR